MTDATPYKFETHAGWPPDGEPGLFYGFDADMNSAVLLWRNGQWHGVRFQFDNATRPHPDPQAFVRGEGTEDFVLSWARAPMRHSEAS